MLRLLALALVESRVLRRFLECRRECDSAGLMSWRSVCGCWAFLKRNQGPAPRPRRKPEIGAVATTCTALWVRYLLRYV